MSVRIAIVGMACRYPDARSPSELWENVLAQRRAFRRMPDERLRLADYLSTDRETPDHLYSANAAVIEGYEFDRLHFRVSGNTFRSADLAHWLALDVAARALVDAGFLEAEGLPRETTGVFLGNTLTGEFSRANALRLRWPYVRRTVEANLVDEGWSIERRRDFLSKVEATYKQPFPPPGEDSLAGGLSNTIAGRICNHFDLKGGGYTVDGACASSLLAVANACVALTTGDLDVALAGGVDLSLDPFELVGFAKTGALATDEMRVYDQRSNGFWPGEGCGFVLLMRYEDALAQRLRIYAVIRGWGISSDGKGGITRPEIDGQLLALRKAYSRAGFGIDTVDYFEGHGTGTSVGDAVELQALTRARRETNGHTFPAAISSIKAIIGHTKAAAGVAGLIKATLALKSRIIPPTTGCEKPHAQLSGASPALRTLKSAEMWPKTEGARAGVSSMGFGGINIHVVMEAAEFGQHDAISLKERTLIDSSQDAELFLFGAESASELHQQVDHLLTIAGRLSRAELSDLAAYLESKLSRGRMRAAVVASTPDRLGDCLQRLRTAITTERTQIDTDHGVFFGVGEAAPRIGFLFPGQGSPSNFTGGAWCRRFSFVREIYSQTQMAPGENETATAVAQPAIVTASIAALRVLNRLAVAAQIAVGHSLGELTALHWAGVMDEECLLRTATCRGKAMMACSASPGAMASISAGAEQVLLLLNGEIVSLAGLNSPMQTVISGEVDAIDQVIARARKKNLRAVKLPVSHAFHSPLVAAAAPALASHLAKETFGFLQRVVVSTVTGKSLLPATDVAALLDQQITSPVRFMDAVTEADSSGVDLWLEVGPGQVLRGIMSEITTTPVVSLDAGSESLRGLLCATAAVFVLGQSVNHCMLFAERFTRPFDLNWQPKFLTNPCELAPVPEMMTRAEEEEEEPKESGSPTSRQRENRDATSGTSVLEVITELVAKRAELPVSVIDPESRLLSDLHLNSITVSQLVAAAARHLHLPRPVSPMDFADVTVAEVAQALEDQLRLGPVIADDEFEALPKGVDSWVRPYRVELMERALPRRSLPQKTTGRWEVLASPNDLFAKSLRQKFTDCAVGNGIVLCLSPEHDETIVRQLLEAARLVLAVKESPRFVLVQRGMTTAAFARTLHLEAPRVTTCVVTVPESDLRAAGWVVAEALAAQGYVEAHYDSDGLRHEPVVRPLPFFDRSASLPLSAADVLVVTGGGKGITAECALALARESGARLVLIGRTQPETDEELSSNLKRLTAARIDFKYISADVTDEIQVRELVQKIEKEVGPITGILHGAARNVPQLISALDEEAFRRTLAVKVGGARHLLAAVNPEKLRLLITFGSIIARTGLPGEADYGLANEWLTKLCEEWKIAHPACHCLAVEWSVWSGKGMGARLGRTDRLLQQGITPIPIDAGVAMLRNLLAQSLPSTAVVVMGRFSDLPTFKLEKAELPFLRFLEQPRVYFPNVELVVDDDLSTPTDPYLNDHVFRGERLFPAVLGLEAMAQAAMAVTGSTAPPRFERVSFKQPVVAPETGAVKIRLAVLVRGPGIVEVALRSEETGFQVNHFEATCLFQAPAGNGEPSISSLDLLAFSRLPVDPERDLYGRILFQSGRFRRLNTYHLLRARECIAKINPDGNTEWFIRYLPGQLVLGDPAARDAALHAIQACIPHSTILPLGIERLTFHQTSSERLIVHARECSREGNTFTYNLFVLGTDGSVLEHWEGLRLRAIADRPIQGPWVESLLGPYIERHLQDLIPGTSISVALIRDVKNDRQARSDRAIQIALGEKTEILRRSDGKPEVCSGHLVSASHAGDLTLAIASPDSAGCDIEQVVDRTVSEWLDLLGENQFALARLVVKSLDEEFSLAATRIWTAIECLTKVGTTPDTSICLDSSPLTGWALFSSGPFKIASYATQVQGIDRKLVLSVVTRSND